MICDDNIVDRVVHIQEIKGHRHAFTVVTTAAFAMPEDLCWALHSDCQGTMVDHILEASDLSAFSCIILIGISQIYVEFTSDESLSTQVGWTCIRWADLKL